MAYFSLTFKELFIDLTKVSNTKAQKLDGISRRPDRIRAFLIGQLGKNSGISTNNVTLAGILNEVFSILKKAKRLVGGRLVILECEPEESLINLYEQHGFQVIETKKLFQTHIARCT